MSKWFSGTVEDVLKATKNKNEIFENKMRKAKPKKRQILPDPVFGDVKVTRFVNHLMYDGKKNTAFEIFYSALETVKAKMPNEEKSALEIWKAALERGGKTMADKLSAEIVDAFNNQGGAFKRKEDMHRMAEANRAFAHFRF